MAKRITEMKHQTAVIRWAKQPSIRQQYPELKLLFHIKNENREGGAQAVAIDKAMGVKKGVCDLCLPVPRGEYHGLFIEMKSLSGKAREEQLWWIDELKAQGYCAQVCKGYLDAIELCSFPLYARNSTSTSNGSEQAKAKCLMI